MIIEITKQKEVKETLEIKSGFYNYGYSFLKISEAGFLKLHNSPRWKTIEVCNPEIDGQSISSIVTNGKEITEEEFNQAYCELHNEMAAIQLDQLKATA